MRYRSIIPVLLLLSGALANCKKKSEANTDCFSGVTIRQIVNKQAIIKLTATINPVYIIEDGSIDTKLIPCSFPPEFYQNDLHVTISGEVKGIGQPAGAPCCQQGFVITKISR